MSSEQRTSYSTLKEKKHLIATILFAVHITLITVYFDSMQYSVGIFTAIPIMVIPFLFGLKIGIVNYCLYTFIITPTLLSCLSCHNAYPVYFTASGLGNVMGLAATLIIGYVHDLHKTINNLNTRLIQVARIDPLTQINNRRSFYDSLKSEYIRAMRKMHTPGSEGTYCCALLDIDHFKKINDKHGHLVGDKVLIKLADFMNSTSHGLRESDVVGRFGGEEFIILLPDTTINEAKEPLARLKEQLNKEFFQGSSNREFSVTFSCGISQVSREDNSFVDIIHRADKALYYAKDHGRDSIIVYEETESLQS